MPGFHMKIKVLLTQNRPENRFSHLPKQYEKSVSFLLQIPIYLCIEATWKPLAGIWYARSKYSFVTPKKMNKIKYKKALTIFRRYINKYRVAISKTQDQCLLFKKKAPMESSFPTRREVRGEGPAKHPMETHDWLQNCNPDLISFK